MMATTFTILLVATVLAVGFAWIIGKLADKYLDPDIDDNGE